MSGRRVAAQRAQDAPAKALRRRRRVARVALALAPSVLATVHALSLLRGHPVTPEAEIERFVADLKQAADALG